MVSNSKQQWEVGQTVKVGFMQLTVRQALGAVYILTNKAGDKLYAFEPYTGCRAIDADELRYMRATAERHAASIASQAFALASRAAEVDALFAAAA